MSNRDFWDSLSQAMRDGTRTFYRESPTHRTTDIDNEVMLAQRREALRRHFPQHNGGNPIVGRITKALKKARVEAKRKAKRAYRLVGTKP